MHLYVMSLVDESGYVKIYWLCQVSHQLITQNNLRKKTTPNRELTTEEFDYYIEIEEKLRKWDGWAQKAYLDWLKDTETSEEKEQCYRNQERYVAWSQAIQAKIRYAFQTRKSPEKGFVDGQINIKEQENEYLDLEQPGDVPAVCRVS